LLACGSRLPADATTVVRRPPTARQALAVIARAPGGGLRLLELTAGAPFLQQKWVGALRLIVDNATRVGELAAAGDL
jgi:hypothetical protein